MTAYDNWKLGVNDPYFDSEFDPEEHGWKPDGVNEDGEFLFSKWLERKLTAPQVEAYMDRQIELSDMEWG